MSSFLPSENFLHILDAIDYLADDDSSMQPVTIAAHKDGENFTPEELQKIEEYKELLLAARRSKE